MEKYLPTVIILALLTRILIMGAGIGEAIAFLGLAGLYGFHLYLQNKKEPVANKDLWDRMIALEEAHKSTREKINSVQLGSTFKR